MESSRLSGASGDPPPENGACEANEPIIAGRYRIPDPAQVSQRHNPHFSPAFYCGGGSGHVYCVALPRAPRRTVKYACGALGRAPGQKSGLNAGHARRSLIRRARCAIHLPHRLGAAVLVWKPLQDLRVCHGITGALCCRPPGPLARPERRAYPLRHVRSGQHSQRACGPQFFGARRRAGICCVAAPRRCTEASPASRRLASARPARAPKCTGYSVTDP